MRKSQKKLGKKLSKLPLSEKQKLTLAIKFVIIKIKNSQITFSFIDFLKNRKEKKIDVKIDVNMKNKIKTVNLVIQL